MWFKLTEHEQAIVILVAADAQVFLQPHYTRISDLSSILDDISTECGKEKLRLELTT